jgi:Tol biopolymer transport system component/TolA-binding protein
MKTLRNIAALLTSILILIGLSTVQLHAQETPGQLYERALIAEEVQGDLSKAITLYQQVINQNPDNREMVAQALLHMGMCYEKQGSEQARQAYRDIINKYADQEEEAALAKQRINHLEAQVNELNLQARQHMKQGNELFKLWEYEDAIKEYESAIKLRPESLLAMNARYCIGQSLYRAGDYDAALATFTSLLEKNPQSNIAPVTELMVSQVQHAMEQTENKELAGSKTDSNTLVDPESGITFKRTKTLTGVSDIITYTNSLNLSPNGKHLLSGNKVVPLDGSAPFELIDHQATGLKATRSTWSPDGTKVAFFSGDAMCVIPVSPETGYATGSLKRIVEGHFRYQSPPAWSPNGKRIAYHIPDGNIWTVDVQGEDIRQITDSEALELGPAWSPDGSKLAYGIGNRGVGIYDLKNGKAGEWIIVNWQKLQFYNRHDRSKYEFSPPKEVGSYFSMSQENNKMLFFRSSYFYNTRLKIASSKGGPSFEPLPLLTSWGVNWWSKDNNLMAVQGENEKGEIVYRIVSLSGKASEIIELDHLTEGKPFPFTASKNLDKIFFVVEREDGKEDLYFVPIAVKEARTAGPAVKIYEGWYNEGAFNVRISVSPDGEKVALIDQGMVWIIFTDGDTPKQIQNVPDGMGYLRWTPDGKSLLYANDTGWNLLENPGPQQRIIPLKDNGNKIECRFWHIDISPDLSCFAIRTEESIKIIPFDPDKTTRILELKELAIDDCYNLSWSPDGENLAFIGQREADDPGSDPDEIHEIYNVPLNGDPPIKVAPDDVGYKWGLSWSPDGKWIAFGPEVPVKVRLESSLWEADFDEVIEKLAAQE